MKKLIYLLVILSVVFTTFSCEKEKLDTPPSNQSTIIDENLSVFGTWELISGKMYIENLETHEKYSYDHFSSTQTISSTRFAGAMFEIENITVNKTRWTFTSPVGGGSGVGTFVLNGDTNNPYGFNVSENYWSIIEHPLSNLNGPIHIKLGGSARPLHATIADYSSSEVFFYTQEAYENIDGYNCKYFSELRFRKIN